VGKDLANILQLEARIEQQVADIVKHYEEVGGISLRNDQRMRAKASPLEQQTNEPSFYTWFKKLCKYTNTPILAKVKSTQPVNDAFS
jgi:hypothetical protein